MLSVKVDDALFLLNDAERKAIRRREGIAIGLSAFIGAMGVILLYVPYYLDPEWFPLTPFTLFGHRFEVPIVFLAYSFILVLIELGLLALLNIWCAHAIAVATGFLDYENRDHADKRNLLVDIGIEKKNKQVLKYGIDPLLGINRQALLLWNLLFILKATLTNFLFRFVIQRVLGRHLIRAVQDFAGIPIFAFWNAYGTYLILREARIIIMGQNLVEVFLYQLQQAPPPGPEAKSLYADTMQFIAVNKRDFHQNHYLLTRNLFALFAIEERSGDWQEAAYLRALQETDADTRRHCIALIVLGLVLDGKISAREKSRIRTLHENGLLPYRLEAMQQMARDFMEGRGIDLDGLIAP